MKTVILCGIAVLICCGCRDASSPRAVQTRRERVGGMMKAYCHSKYEFEVRGPLTLAQFEKELREFYAEGFELREKVHGETEESVDSAVGRKCVRFKGLSRERDELYFFTSEAQSSAELAGIDGYVSVRKNKIIDMMVRSIN